MARSGRTAPPWDRSLTVALLVLGVINVTQTVAWARDLPEALQAGYDAQNIGTFASTAAAAVAGPIVIAANVLAMVLAIGFAVPRIRAKRMAFWIPLVCAGIATGVTFALVMATVASDPAFVAYVQQHS